MKEAEGAINLIEEENKLREELENSFPRTGDKLFISTPKAAFVDCTGFTGSGEGRSPIGRRALYARGYLLAADRLVESWQGLPHEDCLIYPVFHLYRHYVELEMKGAISLSLALHDGPPEEREKVLEDLTKKHGIQDLWNTLKSFAAKVVSGMGATTTAAFESLVKEADEHDPNGQAAGYAFYRDGKQTFLALHEVDLDNLKIQFGKMGNYLGSLEEGIHQEMAPEE
jgi:hypothetical protein